jgi:hypothetical protein
MRKRAPVKIHDISCASAMTLLVGLCSRPRAAPDRSPAARERVNAERKQTAQELADIISAEINVGGTFIEVHPDKVHGWHPTVVAAPQNAHALQKAAETIANRLRAKYELKSESPWVRASPAHP